MKPSMNDFTWGRQVRLYEVGRYTILEYLSSTSKYTETLFHCWVDDRDLHESAPTLDMALLICIGSRDGQRHNQAVPYAAKLLDLKY